MEQQIGTNILGWIIDTSLPVYLIHPNFKFWQCNADDKSVTYRVGKLKNIGTTQEQQTNIEQVQKSYPSNSAAIKTIITKIQEKLTKGYEPKNGKKAPQKMEEQDKKQSKRTLKKKQEKQEKSQKKEKSQRSKVFSGEYYEKGSESIKLQVSDKRVKITKVADGQEGFQIRKFGSYDDAVDFCLQEESWMLGEGYRAINSKFIYSFIDDLQQEQQKPKPKDKTQKKGPSSQTGLLSITGMTDVAVSHRSRNNSSAKSDRSYADDEDNSYVPSRLGAPISGCIKVLLAETWNNDVDPTGWIMSEKLDGVRCFWTGTTMYSRNANKFFFPKFFTKGWPKSQMDGELFIDRGQFSKTLSAVKKHVPINQQWQKVKYLVFDCPGLKKPFKQRIQMMEKVIKQIDNPYIKCHGHRQCTGYEDLFHQLDEVNKIEGQGLMLRDPESFYENRRSKSLLKVKTFHDDEAVVLGYKAGTGRCTGMVGALKVKNTHGVEFEVGSGMTDEIRRHPPKIGSKITYKYQQFNKDSGKPRFPTYMRKFDKI